MSENQIPINQMFDGLRRLVRDVSEDGRVYSPGLDGVVATETSLTSTDGLLYQGYEVDHLASAATYPEVAWLMLNRQLPTAEQYADFRSMMNETSTDPTIAEWVDAIPMSVSLSDVLRSAVSMLGHFDAQPDDTSAESLNMRMGRLLSQLPQIMASRFRGLRGLEPVEFNEQLSYVSNLYRMLTGNTPSLLQERAVEAWLIICCDGQFDSAAFAARVAGSSTTDLFAILSAAMATFSGRRHSPRHVNVLSKILQSDSVETAERRLRAVLAKTSCLDGFVSAVTHEADPRVELLSEFCAELAAKQNRTTMELVAARIEEVMYNEFDKSPIPLWPGLRLQMYLGLDSSLLCPLMMVAKLPAWAAHAVEQGCVPKPIRPIARYIGPAAREFRSLVNR